MPSTCDKRARNAPRARSRGLAEGEPGPAALADPDDVDALLAVISQTARSANVKAALGSDETPQGVRFPEILSRRRWRWRHDGCRGPSSDLRPCGGAEALRTLNTEATEEAAMKALVYH